MVELLIIIYIVLTIISGFNEADYLTAQSNYWDKVPIGDYEYYEDAGVIKHSLSVWVFPIAIPICYLILHLRNRKS